MRWLVLLFLVAATPAQAQSLDRYVRMFEATAFGNDFGPDHEIFDRWESPEPGMPAIIRVRILGDDHGYRAEIAATLVELSDLTGHDIRLAVGPVEIASILIRFENRTFCLVQNRVGSVSTVMLNFRFTKTCIKEELVQALALSGDSCIIVDSIFCGDVFRETYSRHDKILIRAAFDPRLQAGMPRDDAMAVARIILRELYEQEYGPIREDDARDGALSNEPPSLP